MAKEEKKPTYCKLATKYIHTHKTHDYLKIVINVLAMTMISEVLQMRGGANTFSHRMHMYCLFGVN